MTATPAQFNDGDLVTVSWYEVPSPSRGDYVTMTCGATNHRTFDDYLQRLWMPKGWRSGSGSLVFGYMGDRAGSIGLLNMRCDYVFHYVSVASGSSVVLGTASSTPRLGYASPMQGHLALTGAIDEMAATWVSGALPDGAAAPFVRWGASQGACAGGPGTVDAAATSVTYTAEDMCGAKANKVGQRKFRSPGLIHTAVIRGLIPGSTVYYCYGSTAGGMSKEWSFKAAPPKGALPVSMLAYGDMGVLGPASKDRHGGRGPSGQVTAQRAAAEVARGGIDAVLHFGDLSYAHGRAVIWERWFSLIEPIAARAPYMVSAGNHEYDHTAGGERDPSGAESDGFHPPWGNYGDDSRGECGVPYAKRFTAPPSGHGAWWYSVDVGGVHVIQLSSEHDFTPASQQYRWLESDLAACDRTVTPWVVLTLHRPVYSTQTHLVKSGDWPIALRLRESLEGLVHRYGVSLVYGGHEHNYERSCPVYRGRCVADGAGTVYVVSGAAGAPLQMGDFSPSMGEWGAAAMHAWGYTRLRATADELRMQFVTNADGRVADEAVIPRWSLAIPGPVEPPVPAMTPAEEAALGARILADWDAKMGAGSEDRGDEDGDPEDEGVPGEGAPLVMLGRIPGAVESVEEPAAVV